MIEITPTLHLDESELIFDFIRAAGPGGQNVNKVATACQLRFDVSRSTSLPPEVKARLISLAGSRMTEEGVLVLKANRYRTQEQNRFDALQRLAALIQQASIQPKLRRATRPSLSARADRLAAKKKRGEIKQSRRVRPSDFD